VFCSVFLLFCSYTVSSQVLISLIFGDKLNSDRIEFGLEGGFNFSQIGALDADKRLSSFNLGFYFDYRLKDSWKFYTGVLVKSKLGVAELSDSDPYCYWRFLVSRKAVPIPSTSTISWFLP
ncbi:MAG: hypothetical protein WBV75_09695, partial [Robiginitalea sp.]